LIQNEKIKKIGFFELFLYNRLMAKNFSSKQFYQKIQKEIEKDLLFFLKKLKLYPQITVEMIKEKVFNCKEEKEMEVFDEIIKKAKEINPKLPNDILLDFYVFLHNQVWNYFPVKFLGGKSPAQFGEELVWQNPKKNIGHHPLVLGLTLSFKVLFEQELNQLKDNKKMLLKTALPLLFKRYWFSPAFPNTPSAQPFISFIKIANLFQLSGDFFITPFYLDQKLIFEFLPIEEKNWYLFPLIFDLSQKKSYFYAFSDYTLMVDKLRKMNLPKDLSFFPLFVEFLLLSWKDQDPVLKNLSDKEWLSLWRLFLEKAGKEVVNTEAIIYPIILTLRNKGFKVDYILDWMAKWPKIKDKKNQTKEEEAQSFFFFKLTTDFDRLFITPLVLALPLMYPLYKDFDPIPSTIDLLFKFKSDLVLYRSPTDLTFNEFGRYLIKKFNVFSG